MLSRWPVGIYEVTFDSLMYRFLLVAICPLLKLAIGTAHFESLQSPRMRKKQIEMATEMLSRKDIPEGYESILMGDFNFDPSYEAE